MGARRERLLRPRPYIGARTMRLIEDSIRQGTLNSREFTVDLVRIALGRQRVFGTPWEPYDIHWLVGPIGASVLKIVPRP